MKRVVIGAVLVLAFAGAAAARDERPSSAAATGQYLPLAVLNNLNGVTAGATAPAPAAPQTSDPILHRMFVTGDGTSHLQSGSARARNH